jgi:DNA-binding NarL/FixJ family response regulator
MKILIADDHEVVRQGVRQILTEGFEKVTFGEAVNATELLAQVWKQKWEREYALRALRAGAAGYLTKQGLGHELVEAVKKVLGGGRYITPTLAELLAADLGRQETGLPHEKLSDREYEVMKLIAAAKSVKEIASELSLSEKTVFTYRTRLLGKLGVKSDVEVAHYAIQHRLVELRAGR